MKLTSRISFYIIFSLYLCDNSIITDTEMKKILLLGSGELGKEFVISAQRKGQYIIACDSYAGAPAMQVADECEVFSICLLYTSPSPRDCS